MSRYGLDIIPSRFEVRRMAGEIEDIENLARMRSEDVADKLWDETMARYGDLYKDEVRLGILIAMARTCLEESKALNIERSGYGER